MRIIISLVFILFFQIAASCQDAIFRSIVAYDDSSSGLNDIFTRYSTFSFDVKKFNLYLTGSRSVADKVNMVIHGENYTFFIEPVEILAPDVSLSVLQQDGKSKYTKPVKTKTYKGLFSDGRAGFLRLTISDHFMYALINDEGRELFIEPLKYFSSAGKSNQFIFYDSKDIKSGSDSYHCFRHELAEEAPSAQNDNLYAGACYKVKLAILADYSMFTDPAHSGVDAVIDHVLGVMNNVQSNFEYNGNTNFNDGVNFEISELIVSTCPTCDPLSNQSNAGNLLAEFSAWVDQNGFAHPFHAAHFWTNRDLDNSTVGVAFQSQNLFCQSRARAVFEDWTTSAALLKITVSHEIGHSFSGVHDASNSNFILAPSININNTSWSSTSKSAISSQIASQGTTCLSTCIPANCIKLDNVVVTNMTNQNFTISWSSSPQQWYTVKVKEVGQSNFIVDVNTGSSSIIITPPGYGICKKYDVYVYNNCSGFGLSTPVRILNIGPVSQGCADFSVNKNVGWAGSSFSFTDKSLNASSWFWSFGNGQTSTLRNPTVTFTNPGQYNVSLTVNGVHSKNMNAGISILPHKNAPFTLSEGGDFESGAILFSSEAIEGSVNVWEYGTSSYVLSTQGKAWKSKLNGDIPQVTSKSALYSPAFDFTGYQNYTLYFDLGMEVAYCNAPFAVQMQYSVNNGITWSRLGSSPSFYNAGAGAGCKIASQIFSDTTGWTLNTHYANKSLDLSFLAGNSSVIFRFVAGISGIFNGGYNIDGVLIDNFRIEAYNPNPLPLIVSSLKAYPKHHVNVLEWESFLPDDISGYKVLRSHDGINFIVKDSIRQQNNKQVYFRYTDENPLKGINYYKIRAIHHDGTETLSDIAKARQDYDDLMKIFPNPIPQNQSLQIEIQDQKELLLKPKIYDLVGKEVNIPDGKWHQNTLQMDFLYPSVYFIYISLVDGRIINEKILVL